MMRILVMQTTRMGDTLQTSPLIRALRTRYPDAHITAMVRRMGVPIVEANPDVNDVIVYHEEQMFLDVRSQDSDRYLNAYRAVEDYVRQVREGAFDRAYNCTNNLNSAMLLKMAGIREVVGAHLSSDWRFVLRGRMVTYFFTSVRRREYNDLNLCDMFRLFMDDAPPCQELVFEVTDEARHRARDMLAGHGIGDGDFVVCMQLGASDVEKRWPEGHFAALARRLAQEQDARIVLLGVESEAGLGAAFEQHAPGLALHLFGKTKVPELAAVLERAQVLVTNDTGTMHIAAAVKCPVVLVSVGYVHFRETGPYGSGHCAIEPRRDALADTGVMRSSTEDRGAISPGQVHRALEWTLEAAESGSVPNADSAPGMESVNLHMADFAPDGCLSWYPLLRQVPADMDMYRLAYRAMWLDEVTGRGAPSAEEETVRRFLARCHLAGPPDAWRKRLAQPFEELCAMAERGQQVTQGLLSHLEARGPMREARELVAALMQLDEEIRLFGEVNDPVRSLVGIAQFERDNLEGAEPVALAQTTAGIYRDLFERSQAICRKLGVIARVWRGLAG